MRTPPLRSQRLLRSWLQASLGPARLEKGGDINTGSDCPISQLGPRGYSQGCSGDPGLSCVDLPGKGASIQLPEVVTT